MRKPIILSTKSSNYFARLISLQISSDLIATERKIFGGGERYFRIEINDRTDLFGRDIIYVGSTSTDDDLNELKCVGTAAAKYGARRVIYVIPFEGYTTMERAVKPGEIVTAKIIARELSQIPQGDCRNCFLFLDLHTAGFVHYFEGNCLSSELYGEPVLTAGIKELKLVKGSYMFGSADLSRSKWIDTFANMFGAPLAFVRKKRDFEKTKIENVVGDVDGKIVVIYDDMIRSAGTLIDAANAYHKKGAAGVYAVASHFALNDANVLLKLEMSVIEKIITTNSHPMSQPDLVFSSQKVVIKDVSHLFVNAIRKLLGGE